MLCMYLLMVFLTQKLKKNVAHYCKGATMAVFGNFCPKNAREHNQIILLWNDQVMVVIFVLFLIMYYILFLPRKSVLVCFFAVWPPLPATDTVYHFYQKFISLIKNLIFIFNNQNLKKSRAYFGETAVFTQ